MKIRQIVLDEMKKNRRLINLLAINFDVHSGTVERWIKTNDIMLTTMSATNIIAEEMKLQLSEIVE